MIFTLVGQEARNMLELHSERAKASIWLPYPTPACPLMASQVQRRVQSSGSCQIPTFLKTCFNSTLSPKIPVSSLSVGKTPRQLGCGRGEVTLELLYTVCLGSLGSRRDAKPMLPLAGEGVDSFPISLHLAKLFCNFVPSLFSVKI